MILSLKTLAISYDAAAVERMQILSRRQRQRFCRAVAAALMKQKFSRVATAVSIGLGVGEVRHSGNCK